MSKRKYIKAAIGILTFALMFHTYAFAQNTNKPSDPTAQMLVFSAPAANHLLLGQLAGNWNFHDAKLVFVKGTLSRKAIYNGRFFLVEIIGGKLKLPIENGKMIEDNYQSMQTEGYDNVRKKFIMTSINNHIGSDIQEQSGDYDPGKKQFTYTWEDLLMPATPVLNKRVLSIIDPDHYKEEYFEVSRGKETKVRELDYDRVK